MSARFPRSWRIRAGATRAEQAEAPTATPWYQITNAGQAEATVLLFDEIGYWGITASDFARELEQVTARRISVRINSPGGEVFDGLAVAEAIKRHPAAVTVYVDGVAASIASVIALAGERLVMGESSMLMIHEASGVCVGTAADMGEQQALLERVSDTIAAVYAKKAGGPVQEWRARMLAETWFSASEAVALGLADEVAGVEPDEDDDEDQGEKDVELVARFDMAEAMRSAIGKAGAARATPAPAGTAAVFANALRAAVDSSVVVEPDAVWHPTA